MAEIAKIGMFSPHEHGTSRIDEEGRTWRWCALCRSWPMTATPFPNDFTPSNFELDHAHGQEVHKCEVCTWPAEKDAVLCRSCAHQKRLSEMTHCAQCGREELYVEEGRDGEIEQILCCHCDEDEVDRLEWRRLEREEEYLYG